MCIVHKSAFILCNFILLTFNFTHVGEFKVVVEEIYFFVLLYSNIQQYVLHGIQF